MLCHRFVPRRALSLLALLCLIPGLPVAAQQPPAPGPPAATPAPARPGATVEKKPDYGQWWLMHAREVNPRPPGWLFHSEGQGSFANSTGSVSGFQYTFTLLSAQRKGLVTNQVFVSANIQEQRLEDNGGFFKQTTARLSDMFLVNIARPLNLVTALIWEKDEPKQVLHRVALFEGLARNVKLGKGRVIGLSAAIGYEDEHDFSPNVNQDQGSPTVYLLNTFNAPIAMKGVFTHNIEMFFDLVNHQDFRLNWNLNLNLQVTPHIGIGPAAQIRYDGQPVLQVESTDTMVMFAVQFK